MAKDEYQELLELRKIIKEQKQQIDRLENQIENLTQAILHAQKRYLVHLAKKHQ